MISEAQKVWTFQVATFNAQKLSGQSAEIVFATKKARKSFSRQKSVYKLFLQQNKCARIILQQKSVG